MLSKRHVLDHVGQHYLQVPKPGTDQMPVDSTVGKQNVVYFHNLKQ